jgi:hypothetical protein
MQRAQAERHETEFDEMSIAMTGTLRTQWYPASVDPEICSFHETSLLVHVLSQLNPVYTITQHFSIHFNIYSDACYTLRPSHPP